MWRGEGGRATRRDDVTLEAMPCPSQETKKKMKKKEGLWTENSVLPEWVQLKRRRRRRCVLLRHLFIFLLLVVVYVRASRSFGSPLPWWPVEVMQYSLLLSPSLSLLLLSEKDWRRTGEGRRERGLVWTSRNRTRPPQAKPQEVQLICLSLSSVPTSTNLFFFSFFLFSFFSL